MTTARPDALDVEGPTLALLALIEADRERQCARLLGEASASAEALRSASCAEARQRVRQAFEEQRRLSAAALAAAQARLATSRRLHAQQRLAACLREAWRQLPQALMQRWSDPVARQEWLARIIAAARQRLPAGAWQVVHAPHWPAAERAALAAALAAHGGQAVGFEPDPQLAAGLKLSGRGNVIDGTLEGLLADRGDIESRLLRLLETAG